MIDYDNVIKIKCEKDPNCYPNTNVLKNIYNITDSKKLETYEKYITGIELYKMIEENYTGNFDVEHYKDIHKRLFSKVYTPEIAGTLRNYDLIKAGTCFCIGNYVEDNLKSTLERMKKDMHNINTLDDYINNLVHYYSDLNMIHPFREGNGRTLREFLRQYVVSLNDYYNINCELDYSKMDSEKFFNNTVKDDFDGLKEEFTKAFVDVEKEKKARRTR
ncbi:MAG: Fic family protein [Bacilli bacterium]|nr:Fic family protein [Bacilli bacterium]